MAGYKPGDFTAIGGDACDVILAAVLEIKIDVPSVFRKFEPRDVAIEVLGKEPGFAALGADLYAMNLPLGCHLGESSAPGEVVS